MKKYVFMCIILGTIFITYLGCESTTEPTEEEIKSRQATLNGQVLHSITETPLDSAFIEIFFWESGGEKELLLSDSLGKYSYTFETDQPRRIQVTASKETFHSRSTNVTAFPGVTQSVEKLKLLPTASTTEESGHAASIYLLKQSVNSIGVVESGAPEIAVLTFEVQDSSGIPIDIDHKVAVQFSIGTSPGGGESLYPAVGETANNGRVQANLKSGTRAGVVQIIATITQDGKTIRSMPVAVTIHGGLPVEERFDISSQQWNFPVAGRYGLKNTVTAYVGDRYSNPVRPGTAVYFSSTGGIIEGSSTTDNLGQASVSLISAKPLYPVHPDPNLGAGYGTITACTIDANQDTIKSTGIMLFSGSPVISMEPSTVEIPHNSLRTFTYTVSDHNGNPLGEGTSISVSVKGEGVDSQGALAITLPMTLSRAFTQFSFSVFDTTAADTSLPMDIEITTTGPNGRLSRNYGGTSH